MLKPLLLAASAALLAAILGAAAFADEPAGPQDASVDELAQWLDARFAEVWRETQPETQQAVVDDATFLRRVYLDLVGTIPTVAQARDFLTNESPDKRSELIDRLLADPRSPSHLSRVWRRMMIPPGTPAGGFASQFEPWLARQFAENVSYDEMVRRLLTATSAPNPIPIPQAGPPAGSPLAFYMAVGNTPDNLASAFSRVFLGVRIGCAKCHNHPFADWRQEDFWGMAAFFAGMNMAGQPGAAVTDAKVTKIKATETETEYPVRYLWSDGPAEIPDDKSARAALADWMVAVGNPNFAATAVNRVWQQLCGQGLYPQVDDLDLAKPSERAMLDELARRFAASGYSIRWLVRGICRSRVYQRPVYERPEDAAADDPVSVEYSPLSPWRPLKTLTPEQVFDSLEQALMLPVSRGGESPRHNGQREQLIARLDEASAEAPDQFRAGIPQTLIMWHGVLVSNATDLEDSRTLRAVVDAPFLEPREKIETLFLAALTRKPSAHELGRFLEHVASQPNKDDSRRAYSDIYWALLNSPEFVLCR